MVTTSVLLTSTNAYAERFIVENEIDHKDIALAADALEQVAPLTALVFMRMPTPDDGDRICELNAIDEAQDDLAVRYLFVLDEQFEAPSEDGDPEDLKRAFACLEKFEGHTDYGGVLAKKLKLIDIPYTVLSNGKKIKRYSLPNLVFTLDKYFKK